VIAFRAWDGTFSPGSFTAGENTIYTISCASPELEPYTAGAGETAILTGSVRVDFAGGATLRVRAAYKLDSDSWLMVPGTHFILDGSGDGREANAVVADVISLIENSTYLFGVSVGSVDNEDVNAVTCQGHVLIVRD
jgi:hypothetical protein